jgi:hypothetical protein
MVKLIRGPSDCQESHFSAFDVEERIRDIDGVLDVFGEDGGDFESSDKIRVVLNSKYRGKEEGERIKTDIERLAGCNVRYTWSSVRDYKS